MARKRTADPNKASWSVLNTPPKRLPKDTAPKAGLGTGNDGRSTGARVDRVTSGGDKLKLDGKQIVQRRHVDWLEHQLRWRWLMDSLEGGDRYRNAVYGPDRKGLPCRNLFRHKREYPDAQQFPSSFQGAGGGILENYAPHLADMIGPLPGQLGADPAATAMDDDYELRRSRTPIPEFVAEALECHLAKVFDQEVSRDGPTDLIEWWLDVDGAGTPIDDYMRETIAPLLLVLGCLDVCLDHPKAAPGQIVKTKRDEIEAGLDKVVSSYILPMNMVWWRTDASGQYLECLVREYVDPADRKDYDRNGNAIDPESTGSAAAAWRNEYVRWRLWRSDESILFSNNGDTIVERVPHNFGRIPIIRLVDIKKHRTRNVGKSRYEAIAEIQRDFYNLDSELTLSNVLQSHPFLSGSKNFCKADNTMSVGPGYILPMDILSDNNTVVEWKYVSPPKDPAEMLRKCKEDMIAMKDRRACLSKPAGAETPGTVGQSAESKTIDAHTGHKMLTSIAKSLAKTEIALGELALVVLRAPKPITPADEDAIKIGYPARFELHDANALIDGTTKLQLVLASCGNAPNTERELIQATIRQLLLGLDDDEYKVLDDEIELLVETRAQLKVQEHELKGAVISSRVDALADGGSEEQAAGADPTGESGGTAVSGVVAAVSSG
jgi:hypothetical protein